MFQQLQEKAKQMIENGEDEMAMTTWVDGHYVTAVITASKPNGTTAKSAQPKPYSELDNNPDQYGY